MKKHLFLFLHDPRPGAEMTKLFMKDSSKVSLASNQVNFKPKPGTIIMFPGYVPHEFAVDPGLEPFKDLYIGILKLLKHQYQRKEC